MIRKVYEVDPLICPSCGGQMSIISFIEEPKIIDRIIAHLELTFEAERPPPLHHVQQDLLIDNLRGWRSHGLKAELEMADNFHPFDGTKGFSCSTIKYGLAFSSILRILPLWALE